MSIEQESVAKLKEFEGCVSWMYLDTRGNVTVWVGFEVVSAAHACDLPFQIGEASAEHAAIAADWLRVKSKPAGELPQFYRNSTSPELRQSDGDALLLLRWQQDEAALRAIYASYDALPDAAKLALHDMIFNLGASALRHEYPHLHAAIEAADFPGAAAECTRHGISVERNLWTVQQFQIAAKTTSLVFA